MKRPLIFTAMCEIEYKNYNALIKNTKYFFTRGHSVFLTETGQHKKVWKWSLLPGRILLGAQVLCLHLAFQSGSFHSLPWLPKQIASCSIFQIISPPCCFSQGWLWAAVSPVCPPGVSLAAGSPPALQTIPCWGNSPEEDSPIREFIMSWARWLFWVACPGKLCPASCRPAWQPCLPKSLGLS